MFSEKSILYPKLTKWIIRIVSSCILIYLGIRYIHVVVDSIWWVIQLFSPVLLGIIFSIILDIPLHYIENKLFTNIIPIKSASIKRNLSICLSLLSIIGIIILALFLVIPELVQAVITLVNIGINSIEIISNVTETIDYSALPFGSFLESINIDWAALIAWLQNLLPSFMENFTVQITKTIGSSFGIILNIFLGIVFSIYILAQKEILNKQIHRMISIWLPEKCNQTFMHICSVFIETFRNFIVGQTTEALILGTLCTLGMAILQIPYAPTIGVLVGVTAFIPYVGAYIGAIVGFIIILTENAFKALIFIIFLVILQQIEGNVIYPKVVGNRLNLSSLWVLLSLTVGGNLAGPFGMLLGVPIFSAIYKLIGEVTDKHEQNKKLKLEKS